MWRRRTHDSGATSLHVMWGIDSLKIIFLIARLDLDLRHVTLVHAPRTEFEKVATQECFREEARHVVLSADEFDTDLAALDVVTMFEESNVEVLVFPRSFRIVRGEDASQIATVEWGRRNKDGLRPMQCAKRPGIGAGTSDRK